MILHVDSASSVPIYRQIVEQIKRAIAAGALAAGDALPSLRETAIRLRINPLTVDKAYKQLEREGLIETRHGLGSFVTRAAECAAVGFRRELLLRSIDDVLVDAFHLGVSFEELRQLVDERMEAAADGLLQNTFERRNERVER
jgi:GntR family transcriptional regulator